MYPLFKWIFCIQKGEKLSNFRGSRSWRLILLFSVFALVVVACGGDTAEEEVVEDTTETTEAPAAFVTVGQDAAAGVEEPDELEAEKELSLSLPPQLMTRPITEVKRNKLKILFFVMLKLR